MKKILITYHSLTGHNEAMAKAVAEGAKAAGAEPILKRSEETSADDIGNCDIVVFGSPNYFGRMSGATQTILEKIFVELRDEETQKPYAIFSCGGSMGGGPAIASIEEICSHFGGKLGKFTFKKIADGVSATQEPTAENLEQCRELGKKIAAL
jgi:NAD(P)H dehydrogenase (quinone)